MPEKTEDQSRKNFPAALRSEKKNIPTKTIASLIVLYSSSYLESVCEFPEDIRGEWLSSLKGYLLFTNSTIVDYPVALSAGVNSMTFECDHTNNDTYILRYVKHLFISKQCMYHQRYKYPTVRTTFIYFKIVFLSSTIHVSFGT